MNCDEARASIAAGGDEASTIHVRQCGECRSVVATLLEKVAMVGDESVWAEAPRGLGERVSSVISNGSGPESRSRVAWSMAWVAAVAVVVVGLGSLAWVRVTAPDWQAVMYGTMSSVQIDAAVEGWNTPSGTRVSVDARELEPAPSGFVYEMWLSSGPVHLSAGSFGGGEVADLFIGVSRRDFPRLWVTLEPLDEDTAPSGATVLDSG